MRPNPLRRRSAGERAFDLCILPTALGYVIGPVSLALAVYNRHTREQASVDPDVVVVPEISWFLWGLFGFGVLFAVYWTWAFRSVLRSWSDPVVRIQRFCSLALLAGQLFSIYALISGPWM